ncbi:hypothetical protein GRG88_15580 [Listeria monocytogenes]|nr:hypothetical protein [Listeria monocytogenes]
MSDAMFTLCGQVMHTFVQPGGTSKKTGDAYDPRDKVQIMGQLPMPNGGHRLELITLNTEDARLFEQAVGKTVRIAVGMYAVGKSVGYFIPQGAKPFLVQPRPTA